MAQTVVELEARLVKVRSAMDRAILAASYSIGGRSHSNQQLKELRALERSIVLQIERKQRGCVLVSDFSHDESGSAV